MRLASRVLAVLIFSVLIANLLSEVGSPVVPAFALAVSPTPISSRHMTVPVSFTWFDWWMARWENNEVMCRILIEHEGQPYLAEIRQACGQALYNEFAATKACDPSAPGGCRGMYLHYVRTFPGLRNIEIYLPKPQVWVSLAGCDPAPTVNRCTNLPSLLLSGEEQLPNELIIRIQGVYAGEPFSCAGSSCQIPLSPTGSQGVSIEFWGDSSYGDSSEHYKALVRVTAVGDFMTPDGETTDTQQWFVDVLSPQWRDGMLANCSDVWQVFPDIGGPPSWLNTPVKLEGMQSTYSYYYLAGKLISGGQVNAGGCPDGGLVGNMVANQCGLEKAMPQVVDWQNRFDAEILRVARNTSIPAQLMKNIFGRESQFWPGLYKNINEAGLGQLTEKGADTVLLWNQSFYVTFCPLILSKETCEQGFVFLKPEEQNLLRGGLVSKVNAACPTCPVGIDLTQADFSVNVFAQSLLANCSQTGRIVTNVTGKTPGQVSSFVDLWKFTLVNYNAGPGCLWSALADTYKVGEPLTWNNVSPRLDPVCQAAVKYVSAISISQPATPTPTPWVFSGTSLPQPVFPTAPLMTGTPVTATVTGTRATTVPATATPRTSVTAARTATRTVRATSTMMGYPIATPIVGTPYP